MLDMSCSSLGVMSKDASFLALSPRFRLLESNLCNCIGTGDSFVSGWIWSLPFWTQIWVLDCFFVEGQKALFRIGLAIVARWEDAHSRGQILPPVPLFSSCVCFSASCHDAPFILCKFVCRCRFSG